MTRLRRSGQILAFMALLSAATAAATFDLGGGGAGNFHGPAPMVQADHAMADGGYDAGSDAGHPDIWDGHVHGATGCSAVGCTAFLLAWQPLPLAAPKALGGRVAARNRSDGCCHQPPHGPPRGAA